MTTEVFRSAPEPEKHLAHYSLLDALLARRSRRFGKGMRLNGGPLAYESVHEPEPLSLLEEATLAFAACGITGYTMAELPYDTGNVAEAGGGNIIVNFVGRTGFSADAAHLVTLFVMNDDGVWLLKRPQDYPRLDVPELVKAAREQRWLDLYEKSRIRIANQRLDVPREPPFVPPFNKWSANVRGSTYFLPIAELSGLFINVLLAAFSEDVAYFIVDDRNNFRPAGIARFARSKGGYLHDNLKEGHAAPLSLLETWMYEFAAVEQGAMLQNLALATAALRLGGFPHLASHPSGWFQALDFRLADLPFSRTIGAGLLTKKLLQVLKKDIPMPTAVGLERDDRILIKPFCPPYYRTMEEAVLAFVDYKYAQGQGTLRDGGAASNWQDGAKVQAGIPRYSDQTIAATIACCEYIYVRYGRIPGTNGPLRTLMAYQAHHLDADFYQKFYRPEVV
ncbi:MAG TPA: hypothetical protein VKU38_08855 [Ktedonobacteraceae bacterium]|nr:hypothetical protein [Ktedonobacteraceae bacterium]